MHRLNKALRRLFVWPPGWALALGLPAFGLVIYVFAAGKEETLLGYLSYAASAYALAVVCASAPQMVRCLRSNPLIQRAAQARSRVAPQNLLKAELYLGLGINLVYAAVKLVTGILHESVWFISLAGYYFLLAGLKFALAQADREDRLAQWRRCRLCGCILLLMNQALAVVVYLVVRRGDGFEYPGLMVYAVAAYTFYSVISAIYSAVRVKRQNSPVEAAARSVSLVAALVSLLALETALLSQFGQPGQEDFRRLMTGLTGLAVCLSVLWIAVVMLKRAHRALKQGEAMQ
ncbi:MAG: hypothetical protein IJ461_04525 [Clostridia bacterium]|nr:hypothetical protein [Clostridia bacterium]